MTYRPIKGSDRADTLKGTKKEESLYGYKGNDVIFGNGADDILYGDRGNDRLYGGAGGDSLYGQAGNDKLYGGAGNDSVSGGRGKDYLDGGAGDNDTAAFGLTLGDDIYAQVIIDTYRIVFDLQKAPEKRTEGSHIKSSAYGDIAVNVENVHTGFGNDIVRGDDKKNLIGVDGGDDYADGRGGDDILGGYLGNDRLYGGNGNDKIYGEEGRDRLYGGNGNDRLYGGAGKDSLYGGNGNDRLYGEGGKDSLYGNAGKDSFIFRVVNHSDRKNTDIIHSFESGIDIIQLASVIATSAAGLTINRENSHTLIEDKNSDFTLRVAGTFTASDIQFIK
jgi:Ca2+-binding RTX toxin-like protein